MSFSKPCGLFVYEQNLIEIRDDLLVIKMIYDDTTHYSLPPHWPRVGKPRIMYQRNRVCALVSLLCRELKMVIK